MRSRGDFTVKERALYSRLRQLLATPGLVRGSLVEMRRVCGKATCACAGDARRRHRSLYLGVSLGGRRRMLYVPAAWEERVRAWTARYGEIRAVLAAITQEAVQRLEQRAE
jgi:uncharacterized protein DUF6788